jgi:hypothetical protein
VTRDEIDDAAADLGLRLVDIVPRTADHGEQVIFMTRDRRNLVYLLEDARIQARFLILRGHDPEAAERILLARFFPVPAEKT